MSDPHFCRIASSRRLAAVAGIAITLCGGCMDDAWHAETVPAIGTVSVNGEIPVGAIVRLHPKGGSVDQRASRPSGIVGDLGEYTLTTYEFGDGAPPGDYVFTLYWPKDPRIGGLSPDRLGLKFATPKTSPLEITIAQDTQQIEPVFITGADVDSSPAAKPAGKPGPFPR